MVMIGAARVPLGKIFKTMGADADLTDDEIVGMLRRHASGDWGDLDATDKAANDKCVEVMGSFLLSRFVVRGTAYYVQSDWPFSSPQTTVMRADER